MGCESGFLEQYFSTIEDGSSVSICCEMLIRTKGRNLCRTLVHHQEFLTDCDMDEGYPFMTILNGQLQRKGGKVWVHTQPGTLSFRRPQLSMNGLTNLIEACAGIGAVGYGMEHVGVRTRCYVDCNRRFHEWTKQKSPVPSILGNIADETVIAKVAQAVPCAHMLLGGVACQPFSKLGDQRAELDPRSDSFPALLRMGYLLGSLAIVVECTVGAQDSAWVQSLLQQFTTETNFTLHQHVFQLHKTWPAKRERWWAVLTHPSIHMTKVPEPPSHRFEPGLLHLFSRLLDLSDSELQQLRLSIQELCGFHAARGGIRPSILDMLKAMPTATHSWGSQLQACACECRQEGFSERRLQEKGLYGVLVPLLTSTMIRCTPVQDLRHLHPIEVALANGMNPQVLTQDPRFPLRLELAGVGQLASPLQGTWVVAHILARAADQDLIHWDTHPRHVFAQVCRDLLQARDHVWPSVPLTQYMQIFHQEIEAIDRPLVYTSPDDTEELTLTQEIAQEVQRLEQHTAATTKVPKDDDLHSGSVAAPLTDDHTKVPSPFASSSEAVTTTDAPQTSGVGHNPNTMIHGWHGADSLAEPHVELKAPCGPSHVYQETPFHAEPVGLESSTTGPSHDQPAMPSFQPSVALGANPHPPMYPVHAKPFQDTPILNGPSSTVRVCQDATMVQSESLRPISKSAQFQLGAVPGFANSARTRSRTPVRKQDHAQQTTVHQVAPTLPMTHMDSPATTAPDKLPESLEATSPADEPTTDELMFDDPMETTSTTPCLLTDDHGTVTRAAQKIEAVEQRAQPVHTNHAFVVVPGEPIHTVAFSPGQTVGQLLCAHTKLRSETIFQTISTAVGVQIPTATKVKPGHFLTFASMDQPRDPACPTRGPHDVPQINNGSRGDLLWQQKGWVAVDEMKYYLQLLESTHPGKTFGLLILPNSQDATAIFTRRVLQCIEATGSDDNTKDKAFVCLHQHHWFPVHVTISGNEVEVWTTHQMAHWVHEQIQQAVGDSGIEFRSATCRSEFPADCGFQSLGWILSKLREEDTDSVWTARQACQWRAMFHQDLCHNDLEQVWVDKPLELGGTNQIKDQLSALLIEHGVAKSRSNECAEQLLQAFGAQSIAQVLQSPKPWADLTAKASLHQPPIRIVLASELKDVIQSRSKEPKPVGSKANKLKNNQPKKPLTLQADQLTIPHAVFRQEDGVELSQINHQTLGPGSKGILISNIQEALPYFALQSAISQEGVGLLILDHADPRIPPQHQQVRVPVLCKATHEPMIVGAALLQLGAKTVTRNSPAQCLEIQQVDNQVVKVLVYQDQTPLPWKDITSHPVKSIFETAAFQHFDLQEILDVWDRQWLTNRMTKTTPADAALLAFSIRMTLKASQILMPFSGQEGQFYEPRTEDGRKPSPDFQVVWLPRKTYTEAKLAQSTTTVPSTLVRSGDRYGLRVDNQHAEQVHQAHRPDLQFLQGTELKKYKLGPLPYGSTKQSIVNICAKWGWVARPIGPQGQTSDRSGTIWAIQAAKPPANWVYQLAHGDVLISPEEETQPAKVPAVQVLASQKTLQSLQQKSLAEVKSDPWLHTDPWKQQTSQTSREVSVGQVAAIETQVEKRVLAKIQDADTNMTNVDSRVTQLEQQLEKMQGDLQSFQQQQANQNQTVQQQLQSIDHKVERQSQAFNGLLDTKMDEQLRNIERLLQKKPRVGE